MRNSTAASFPFFAAIVRAVDPSFVLFFGSIPLSSNIAIVTTSPDWDAKCSEFQSEEFTAYRTAPYTNRKQEVSSDVTGAKKSLSKSSKSEGNSIHKSRRWVH